MSDQEPDSIPPPEPAPAESVPDPPYEPFSTEIVEKGADPPGETRDR